MSSNFVPLEEAAKRLGVSSQELVEMRSRGDIFGYRDGASWKFKPEEIERCRDEVLGNALDEDPAGSSILVSDQEVGGGSKHGSTIGSDVALVADPGGGSDVKLVAGRGDAGDLVLEDSGSGAGTGGSSQRLDSDLKLSADDDDDDELVLSADDELGSLSGSAAKPASGVGSDVELGSDLGLSLGSGSDLLAGLSPISKPSTGQSDKLVTGGSDVSPSGISLGSDLELSDDDDLVLGGGSDLALGADSGINLMSPSDSGISLEDEPLDLAGSGISGLDLAAEGSDASASGVSAGSGIDFSQSEEFQLSPAGVADGDDDSGSQVIELEDSSEFGDAAVALPADDGGFGDGGFGMDGDGGFGGVALGGPAAGPAVPMGTPEVPYSTPQVLLLLGVLLVMCLSGILVTDVVRNMWMWSDGASDLTSGFTQAVLSITGQKR
jgi:hypothetical protein